MKKFSVRDLFWLVLVAAILCGWWLSYRRQASEIERLETEWKAWPRLRVYPSPGLIRT